MSSQIEASFEAARRRMVDNQVRPSDVTKPDLIDAMLWAPREAFVPKSKRAVAYMGEHIEIAPGRFELDPRVLAKMICVVDPGREDLALVLGSGSGYAAAVLSRLCAAVVALEEDENLHAAAVEALSSVGADTVIPEKGRLTEGCAQHAPYNIVFVNGAVAQTDGDLLSSIVDKQLADGGRLVAIRMLGAAGRCEVVTKTGGAWSGRRAFDATAPVLRGFEPAATFEF